jgi:hypothetical protein
VLGVQGAKPPEADEFLQVKGVLSLNLRSLSCIEYFDDFKPGRSCPVLDPSLGIEIVGRAHKKKSTH